MGPITKKRVECPVKKQNQEQHTQRESALSIHGGGSRQHNQTQMTEHLKPSFPVAALIEGP